MSQNGRDGHGDKHLRMTALGSLVHEGSTFGFGATGLNVTVKATHGSAKSRWLRPKNRKCSWYNAAGWNVETVGDGLGPFEHLGVS